MTNGRPSSRIGTSTHRCRSQFVERHRLSLKNSGQLGRAGLRVTAARPKRKPAAACCPALRLVVNSCLSPRSAMSRQMSVIWIALLSTSDRISCKQVHLDDQVFDRDSVERGGRRSSARRPRACGRTEWRPCPCDRAARSIGACADRPEAARRALSQRSQASARELIVGVSYRTSYVRFSNYELHLLLVPPQRGKGTYYPRQR
jgi:hypothetical protein